MVTVFSEIKRCQNPQFTQIVQRAKKVQEAAPDHADGGNGEATVTDSKFHDANMNGVADPGEEWIIGWPVAVKDPTGVVNWEYTLAEFMVTEGWWTTQEAEPEGTLQTVAMIDGVPMSLYPTANPILSLYVEGDSGEFHTLFYGNVGLGKIVACKAYDRDADGALSSWGRQLGANGTPPGSRCEPPMTTLCSRFL